MNKAIGAAAMVAVAALVISVVNTLGGSFNKNNVRALSIVANGHGNSLSRLEGENKDLREQLGAAKAEIVVSRKYIRKLTAALADRFEAIRMRLDRVDGQTVYRWNTGPDAPGEIEW